MKVYVGVIWSEFEDGEGTEIFGTFTSIEKALARIKRYTGYCYEWLLFEIFECELDSDVSEWIRVGKGHVQKDDFTTCHEKVNDDLQI